MGRNLTTGKRNDEQDMANHQVHTVKEEGRKRRSCEEIREEYTRETGNHIENRKRRIWHQAPLQVYAEFSPPLRS